MKSFILSNSKRKVRKGFSIVEVAIAMGVVTLLLTTFLGVFGPAQKNIQRALSTKDANRMKDTLSNEMSILRVSDSDDSSFAKAFRMIKDSHDSTSAVLMYQYKADPTNDTNSDGILEPYLTSDEGIQGRDYIVQTAVRTLGVDDAIIEKELSSQSVEGAVFVVRMTQIVKDTTNSTADKLVLTARDTAGITDPDTPGSNITDADAYPKAVVAFRAEFFRLSSNNYQYVSSANWNFDNVGNAITEVNMAVRR
ncbi:MAG: type IV pilus modification PilV family protein [Akkermansiaceae bacterium]